MSDRTTEALRAAMGVIVDVAPEPPDFPTDAHQQSHGRPLRSSLVSFAATVALAVIGLLLLNEWSSDPAGDVRPGRSSDVILWQQEGATARTPDEVVDELLHWPGVQFAAVSDGQQAYEAFLEVFSDRPELIEVVDPLEFPDSVRVWTTSGLDLPSLRSAAGNWGFDVQINTEEFTPLYVELGRLDPDLQLQVIPSYMEVPTDYRPTRLLIYGPEPTASSFRRLWIEQVDYEPDYFGMIVADPSATSWEAIDVPTGIAFIDEGELGSTILWQPDTGGGVVRVAGLGFTSDQLTEVTLGMWPGVRGWEPDSLPSDMSPLYDGPDWPSFGTYVTVSGHLGNYPGGALILMQQFTGGSTSVEIDLWSRLARYLGHEADAFGFAVTEVRDKPAYLVEYSDGSVLYIWAETPNHSIELFVDGFPGDSVIAAIVELTPEEWEALRERHLGSGRSSTTTTMAPGDTP